MQLLYSKRDKPIFAGRALGAIRHQFHEMHDSMKSLTKISSIQELFIPLPSVYGSVKRRI